MILLSYGTRPEIIKLFPVINELKKQNVPYKTLFTGQHYELFDDFKEIIDSPDFIIEHLIKGRNLNELTAHIIKNADPILSNNNITNLVVQGDTTSALAMSLAAFNQGIQVSHVEAGLRTYDKASPFPEEMNRQIISRIATYHFCPTSSCFDNLRKEGIKENLYLTGNTVIDACKSYNFDIKYRKKILITLHRRENVNIFDKLFQDINDIAIKYPDYEFIFPMHPNPNVQKHKLLLSAQNIHVINPLGYYDLLRIISECMFVISDSGGIQEEVTAFKKAIIICRNTTERPETIDSGFGVLLGDKNLKDVFDEMLIDNNDYVNYMEKLISPYGDGKASEYIVKIIK
jgi:UDP-N-acetylglucosamine 2-epimerase (non-hydrolysing)